MLFHTVRGAIALWGCAVVVGTTALSASARQGEPPDYGIDFVTIGSPGNAPFRPVNAPHSLFGTHGRGDVDYSYRIGRTEITTSQWMQFVNTFSVLGPQWRFFAAPVHWGAVPDPSYQGTGRRWMLNPGSGEAGMRPCFGIDWREAAMFCNWLHNGQSTDPLSITNGAYDTSTFHTNPDGSVTDQRTHNPDARFWIPTWDEWLKAVHYDPNRYGDELPGWWMYPNQSDIQPIPGPPGIGETSAGYRIEPFGHFDIPLGAYPDTLTPWGLLDATGGTMEWNEETFEEIYLVREYRGFDGNFAGNLIGPGSDLDSIVEPGLSHPYTSSSVGFRIASVAPPASSGVCFFLLFLSRAFTRRRSWKKYAADNSESSSPA